MLPSKNIHHNQTDVYYLSEVQPFLIRSVYTEIFTGNLKKVPCVPPKRSYPGVLKTVVSGLQESGFMIPPSPPQNVYTVNIIPIAIYVCRFTVSCYSRTDTEIYIREVLVQLLLRRSLCKMHCMRDMHVGHSCETTVTSFPRSCNLFQPKVKLNYITSYKFRICRKKKKTHTAGS